MRKLDDCSLNSGSRSLTAGVHLGQQTVQCLAGHRLQSTVADRRRQQLFQGVNRLKGRHTFITGLILLFNDVHLVGVHQSTISSIRCANQRVPEDRLDGRQRQSLKVQYGELLEGVYQG